MNRMLKWPVHPTLGALFLAVLAFVVGNSGCGDGSTGGSGGSARINGTISGTRLVPVSAISGTTFGFEFVFTVLPTTYTAVAISDFADECGNENIVGHSLYFSLFENPTLSNSVVTKSGRFAVWLPDLNGQGTVGTDNQVVALYISNTEEGGSGQLAQSGSVTIRHVSTDAISGSFELTFGDDHLTGTFDAPSCQPWTRSGNIPEPGR